jgi:hypothetical protein
MDELSSQWLPGVTRPVADRIRVVQRPRPVKIRIPAFPNFADLAIEHQFEIEQWVKQFQPYSDFNFVSLWSWNTKGEFEVSWLGDNLVVLFNDYGTNERFFSFLGVDDVDAAAARLIELARARGMAEELRLLPEVTALAISWRSGLTVHRAPEHADYVLSTRLLSDLAGGQFRNKRNEIKRLEREHAPVCREIDLRDPVVQAAIDEIFGRWVVDRDRAGQQDAINESLAVRRVFSLDRPQDLLGIGCYVKDRMIGFSINERLANGYAMGHHCKAIDEFPGAYPMIIRSTSRMLAAKGFDKLNIMQDLGLPGLKTSKLRYRPLGFLHKYRLTAQSVAQPRVAEARFAIGDVLPMPAMHWIEGLDVG